MSSLTTYESFKAERPQTGRLILVSGNFNILHPGHVRLLMFANSCGHKLAVAINSDRMINDANYHGEQQRAEVVSSLGCVDACFIVDCPVAEVVAELRPWAVVKGKEYEHQLNDEKAALDSYGGRLIFSSGDTSQRTSSAFGKSQDSQIIDRAKLNGYAKRHSITLDSLNQRLAEFQNQHVVVIGDTIVDEYIQCNAIGMSQEDPTIVVTPDEAQRYLGGAAITASHAKSLGARKVSFFSVLGDDEIAKFAREKLEENQVDHHVFVDETRPTTLKKRYRVGTKTLLRVNQMKSHDLEQHIQEQIWQSLKAQLETTNLLIFSDFNYGVLPQTLVDKVTGYCIANDIMIAADSQTSSQIGDISRFKHVDLVTPTEREVRVALNNTSDGLVVLAEKLRQKMHCKNVVVTLAEEGAFIHLPVEGEKDAWQNDKIAALAANPVDPAGAGDCLLASASLVLAAGGNLWEATMVGSVAAACQVSRVGNSPLTHKMLKRTLQQLA